MKMTPRNDAKKKGRRRESSGDDVRGGGGVWDVSRVLSETRIDSLSLSVSRAKTTRATRYGRRGERARFPILGPICSENETEPPPPGASGRISSPETSAIETRIGARGRGERRGGVRGEAVACRVARTAAVVAETEIHVGVRTHCNLSPSLRSIFSSP